MNSDNKRNPFYVEPSDNDNTNESSGNEPTKPSDYIDLPSPPECDGDFCEWAEWNWTERQEERMFHYPITHDTDPWMPAGGDRRAWRWCYDFYLQSMNWGTVRDQTYKCGDMISDDEVPAEAKDVACSEAYRWRNEYEGDNWTYAGYDDIYSIGASASASPTIWGCSPSSGGSVPSSSEASSPWSS